MSDDEDEDNTNAEDFQIRSQFEGKGGEKLLALQSRFASDSRFKLGANFKEKDFNIQQDDRDEWSKTETEDSIQAERVMSLKVLSDIIGDSVESKKKKRTVNFKDQSRFDPASKDHAKFELDRKRTNDFYSDEEKNDCKPRQNDKVHKLGRTNPTG